MNQIELEQLKNINEVEFAQEPPEIKSDGREFAEFLLEDEQKKIKVPENFMSNFWISFDKEMALTNLTDDDIKKLMLTQKIVRLDTIMEQPDFKLKFHDLKHLDQVEMKTFIKSKRSSGGMGRERALLATQIKQFKADAESDRPRGGMLSKIGSFFKGR